MVLFSRFYYLVVFRGTGPVPPFDFHIIQILIIL